ncbi:MAG: SLBB domain-containing protein [Deltaproteobacteria bacterium]|nr:MAG: SLBB domain-containing protein [Deltaproteobacteria bacterium]
MRSRFPSVLLLLLAWGLLAAAPARGANEVPAVPLSPSVISSLPPGQALALQEAIRKGELTPEARRIIEAHPDLRVYLPPKWREEIFPEEELPGEAPAGMEEPGKEEAEKAKGIAERPEKALPAPYDWKESVYVSRLFQSRLRDEEKESLTHFGHRLFDPRVEGAPGFDVSPVPDDYVIVPGDEIVVRLWGRMEGTHRMRVDREGKIFFPKLGTMNVAGKTFGELKTFLRGKVGSIAEVRADVSLGQLTGFQVSVLGEVPAPGRYRVSSFHTVLQAIGMAGGIRDIGSLRRVQVKRGKETAREIDVYDFLLRGDVTQDVRLKPGDAVFVPVAGPLVAVAGEVRRQAIYELMEERTIDEVLAMAGGLSPSAYKRRVQVERLEGNRARMVLDLNLEGADRSLSSFVLQDGDILRVLAVLPEEENAVTVAGNVQRPGKFEWKPGLTVGSLIPDEKFFLPETFLDYALITREVGPERRKESIAVNLRRIVIYRDASADVPLQPMDELMVYNRAAFREAQTAIVEGEVRDPGMYEIHPGMRVSDLVKLAGDLTRNASKEEAELSRLDEQRKPSLVKIDLGKALAGDESEDLPVREGDVLMVRQIPDLQEIRYVTVTGEVKSPGVYTVVKGDRLSSVLERAGGFTTEAYLKASQFTRVSTQKTQQEAIDKLIEDLETEVSRKAQEVSGAIDREDIEANKLLLEARRSLIAQLKKAKAKGRVVIRLAKPGELKGTASDILLEDGDRLEVPKKTDVVNVVGRVYNPTGVQFDPASDRLEYYLKRVGGPTESADRDHIFLVKADGSVVTRDNVGGGFLSGGLMSARVEPGDSIVVPEKLIRPRLMKEIKDFTQILYQIAVTAGVLIVVF